MEVVLLAKDRGFAVLRDRVFLALTIKSHSKKSGTVRGQLFGRGCAERGAGALQRREPSASAGIEECSAESIATP